VPRVPYWVTTRTVVLLAGALVLVVVAVFVLTFAILGSGGPNGPESDVVLTVGQALAAASGQDIKVSGYVVSVDGKMVLASALAESFPPQAGGNTVPLAGLDMRKLVGLSAVAAQAGAPQVIWTEYSGVLVGLVDSGTFKVKDVPAAVEATSPQARVRFSAVSAPVSSGQTVWWAMDVTNTTQAALDLTFADGQRGDVVLAQGGTAVYTWSAGQAFDQSVKTVTLAAGETFPVVLSGTLTAPAGTYDVTAHITARIGAGDAAVDLPAVSSTLTVGT